MPGYRRAFRSGATWFFTVALLRRGDNDLLLRHIDELRHAIRRVHRLHPFGIDAWVVLPEHMHCVWTLPPGDHARPLRWRLIKRFFCSALPADTYRAMLRLPRAQRGVWQRCYCEHRIRNEEEFRWHVDYVHNNPLRHGLVRQVRDWPHSTFHRDVRNGLYSPDWAGSDAIVAKH
ncbi:putative transposase [Pseudomonas flavescens]|uniref:Putative transposase n=1 Tax=Phytopseudomonas flavescens TaxID=29435 RepID=A0A1G8FU19_9GAMM|nr:transposase [Pseudomonas flavescens]SDH85648.1 putative transposase [Pseudomonas flavescens]